MTQSMIEKGKAAIRLERQKCWQDGCGTNSQEYDYRLFRAALEAMRDEFHLFDTGIAQVERLVRIIESIPDDVWSHEDPKMLRTNVIIFLGNGDTIRRVTKAGLDAALNEGEKDE